jgi:hypothetical protein
MSAVVDRESLKKKLRTVTTEVETACERNARSHGQNGEGTGEKDASSRYVDIYGDDVREHLTCVHVLH